MAGISAEGVELKRPEEGWGRPFTNVRSSAEPGGHRFLKLSRQQLLAPAPGELGRRGSNSGLS